jgi:hypothetical protein
MVMWFPAWKGVVRVRGKLRRLLSAVDQQRFSYWLVRADGFMFDDFVFSVWTVSRLRRERSSFRGGWL